MMANALSAQGVVGVVTDGPMRDIDEIGEETDLQMLATGLTPAHGDFGVRAVGDPVTLGGMSVSPGDIVHMDVHGACKFPGKYAEEIVRRAKKLLDTETEKKSFFRSPDFSLENWKLQAKDQNSIY